MPPTVTSSFSAACCGESPRAPDLSRTPTSAFSQSARVFGAKTLANVSSSGGGGGLPGSTVSVGAAGASLVKGPPGRRAATTAAADREIGHSTHFATSWNYSGCYPHLLAVTASSQPPTVRQDHQRMRFLRRLGVSSLAAAAVGAVLLVLAPAASAHVTVNPKTQVPGSFGEITFRAPNESANARFTKLVVHLPAAQPFGSLNARTITGWQIRRRPASSPSPSPPTTAPRRSTPPRSPGLRPDRHRNPARAVPGLRSQRGPFPAKGTMTFTVDQYYSDGSSVVHWERPPTPRRRGTGASRTGADVGRGELDQFVGRARSGPRDRCPCDRRDRAAEHDRGPPA